MASRPTVPAEVKAQLRRESGFGCCVCGHPVYQYHHIVAFASDPHFRPEDMMVLCPTCHDMATRGAMDVEQQRAAKVAPRNLSTGRVGGALVVQSRICAVQVGRCLFVNDGVLVSVDGEPILALSVDGDGRVAISVELRRPDGVLLASIDSNEWVSGDHTAWDIEFAYRWLRIRSKARDVALFIDCRRDLIQINANLWAKGQQIELGKSAVLINRSSTNWSWKNLTFVGMYFDIRSEDGQLRLLFDPRHPERAFFRPTGDSPVVEARKLWRDLITPPI